MVVSKRDSASTMRAVEILADLVAFDTISSNSNLALMRYVEALLGKLGIVAELLPDASGTKANLFAAVGPVQPNGVILSGHSDVVPVLGQNWTSDPFVLTRRDGRLYGRGTADMKAFLACGLAALEFADLEALEQPIYLAFSYDEEIGCLGAPSLIEHIRSRVELPAVVIVGEPTTMRIIGSHKSVNIYKVSVSGVPAHSSATHLGLSANTVAIRLMNKLIQMADRLTMSDMQNGDYQPPFSTLTVGLMQGGTAANILAGDASFVFDLRCLPEHEPDEVLAPFFAELELVGSIFPSARVSVESLAAVPALAHVDGGEAELMVRSIGGDNRPVRTVSFGAEAGQFQRAGFSTVLCGPGSMDQGHQPDEYIEIAEIEKCMRFMAGLFGQGRKRST